MEQVVRDTRTATKEASNNDEQIGYKSNYSEGECCIHEYFQT